ncbi:putative glycoprotein 1 [Wenling nido-like virus 1]|uniref:Putative glycoprotein 1 n=1 Tax=Wenling nido-like virus 1 TaxID=1923510 RepID=A0A1L3KIY1_9NIDO|nr:putative glycoprotein 1 [Wenling nido-like virus 1]APG77343.1 putative glycoprotein 1 [Wenling nido-like virus 1]
MLLLAVTIILFATVSAKTSCEIWLEHGYCDTHLERLRNHTRWLCPHVCGKPLLRSGDTYIEPSKQDLMTQFSSPYEGFTRGAATVFDYLGKSERKGRPGWTYFDCNETIHYAKDYGYLAYPGSRTPIRYEGIQWRTSTPIQGTFVRSNPLWVRLHEGPDPDANFICTDSVMTGHFKAYSDYKGAKDDNIYDYHTHWLAFCGADESESKCTDSPYGTISYRIPASEHISDGVHNGMTKNARAATAIAYQLPQVCKETVCDTLDFNVTHIFEGCEWKVQTEITRANLLLFCYHHQIPWPVALHTVKAGVVENQLPYLPHQADGGIYYAFPFYIPADKYYLTVFDPHCLMLSPPVMEIEKYMYQTLPRFHSVVEGETTDILRVPVYLFPSNKANGIEYAVRITTRSDGRIVGTGMFEHELHGCELSYYGGRSQLSAYHMHVSTSINYTHVADANYQSCLDKPAYVLGTYLVLCWPSYAQDLYSQPLPIVRCDHHSGYYYRCIVDDFTGLVYPANGPLMGGRAYAYSYGGWKKLYANPPDSMGVDFYKQYRGAINKYQQPVGQLVVWGPLWSFLCFVVGVWVLILIYLALALLISLLETLSSVSKKKSTGFLFHGSYFVHCFLSFAYFGYPGYKPAWFNPQQIRANAENAKTLHKSKWVAVAYLCIFLFPVYMVVIFFSGIFSIGKIAQGKVKLTKVKQS